MLLGLVSVTFRQLDVKTIIELVSKSKLHAIEWGGDIHVIDENSACETRKIMEENSLKTLSYGSYYKAGENMDFMPILNIAIKLNSPNIRVWAGSKNWEDADEKYRLTVIEDIQNIADLACAKGISISLEYHGNTLTNTQKSTLELLKCIDKENVFTYWQPLANTTHEENKDNLRELCKMKKLKNIHVYNWNDGERLSLESGKKNWSEYLKIAEKYCDGALLEFVKDDSIQQFIDDSKTLKECI